MRVNLHKLFGYLLIVIAILEFPLLFVTFAFLRVDSTIGVVAIVLGGAAFLACLLAWTRTQSRRS